MDDKLTWRKPAHTDEVKSTTTTTKHTFIDLCFKVLLPSVMYTRVMLWVARTNKTGFNVLEAMQCGAFRINLPWKVLYISRWAPFGAQTATFIYIIYMITKPRLIAGLRKPRETKRTDIMQKLHMLQFDTVTV